MTPDRKAHARWRAVLAGVLLTSGILWSAVTWRNQTPYIPVQPPIVADTLTPGTVATMDSSALSYNDGWAITALGADPAEPADPWSEPSGVVTFTYTGDELALDLGVGDYWGYLYVTVDGQPANRLPYIRSNVDSMDAPAGYRTFYEPDRQINGAPTSLWVQVHVAGNSQDTHDVRVEVWRAWEQTPLRGVAVDAMSTGSRLIWPGVALALLGLAVASSIAFPAIPDWHTNASLTRIRGRLRFLLIPQLTARKRMALALACFGLSVVGISTSSWPFALVGLAGLGLLSIARPALWTAALVFSLPFYYSYAVPILPGVTVGLIDAFVFLGVGVAMANWLLVPAGSTMKSGPSSRRQLGALLALIIAWALVSTSAAEHTSVALYEWRTVFLYAGLFAILLTLSLRRTSGQRDDLWLISASWIAGGVIVSLIGLGQYFSGAMLINAEGVHRVRALYGSPNNLALYLERTFIVTLGLAALLPTDRLRMAWIVAALLQGAALLLTFSKGAIFLGIPAGLFTLWLGGMVILPIQGRSRRPLIWLAGSALLIFIALVPFLGTERFSRLFDLSQGTGYLRMQLWRSSLQMAFDHPLLGVGPDNFLYAYRSTYLLPEAWQEPNLNHPHNWVLDWWTRIGLPGLLAAIALFTVGFYKLWSAALFSARTHGAEAFLSLGFLAAGIAALTHGLIDASYALPDLMIVWVLLLMATIATPGHDNTHPDAQSHS